MQVDLIESEALNYVMQHNGDVVETSLRIFNNLHDESKEFEYERLRYVICHLVDYILLNYAIEQQINDGDLIFSYNSSLEDIEYLAAEYIGMFLKRSKRQCSEKIDEYVSKMILFKPIVMECVKSVWELFNDRSIIFEYDPKNLSICITYYDGFNDKPMFVKSFRYN